MFISLMRRCDFVAFTSVLPYLLSLLVCSLSVLCSVLNNRMYYCFEVEWFDDYCFKEVVIFNSTTDFCYVFFSVCKTCT